MWHGSSVRTRAASRGDNGGDNLMLSRAMRAPVVAFAAILVFVAFAQAQASAEQPANDAFQRTWARTDQP
ncbi:MAG TPA: hypothetical protein DEG70_00690, partial [Chloroflexi bacterium]|nr:hypothetical protein [Chloroflexota bacterium]